MIEIPDDKRLCEEIQFWVRGTDEKFMVIAFHKSMFPNFRGWRVHFPTVERKMLDVVFEKHGFAWFRDYTISFPGESYITNR